MIEGEENLIDEAKNGDAGSFGKLYNHYVAPIYRFIYVKVDAREVCEDLTHEVFLSAWQNLHRYKSRGFPFSSWLYQIARNRVIDYYRLKRVHLSIETAELTKTEFVQSNDPDPNRMLDTQLNIQEVKQLIKTLNADQQDVLIMKFIEGMSHAEIAKAMNKSAGAVRLIQHRAINELKKKIDPGMV
jgi:RNA polymerase sigma-70 factor (ECF subfamily)